MTSSYAGNVEERYKKMATVDTGVLSLQWREGGVPLPKKNFDVSISKVYRFEAAHKLPNHPGKCQRLHGHSYKVEVQVEGTVSPESGMVKDFYEVKKDLEECVGIYDHQYLNDFFENPTAEILAMVFLRDLRHKDSRYWSVTVWETEDSAATATYLSEG